MALRNLSFVLEPLPGIEVRIRLARRVLIDPGSSFFTVGSQPWY